MKNLSNLGFIALVLVVLGCSCPKLNELRQSRSTTEPPPSPVSIPTPASSPASTAKKDPTMAQYEQIKTDMKRAEVETILGGKGTEISSSTGGGMTFTVIKWEGENFKTIIITFKNDRVMSKTQAGLK